MPGRYGYITNVDGMITEPSQLIGGKNESKGSSSPTFVSTFFLGQVQSTALPRQAIRNAVNDRRGLPHFRFVVPQVSTRAGHIDARSSRGSWACAQTSAPRSPRYAGASDTGSAANQFSQTCGVLPARAPCPCRLLRRVIGCQQSQGIRFLRPHPESGLGEPILPARTVKSSEGSSGHTESASLYLCMALKERP
jgi:hypothetical protein